MARYEHTVHVDADAARIWDVMMDVEKWPEWTSTTESIERIDAGDLHAGSRVRIKLKNLRAAEWHVTELTPQRSFTWQSSPMPGARAIAEHRIAPNPTGGSDVTLVASFGGTFGAIFGAFFGRMTRGNLEIEATGLKQHSESAH